MPATHYNYADLLYSTLVADGTILPPVVITTDPHVPEQIEGGSDAIVLYMPGISKPSADTTLAYFDAVRDYYQEFDHLIWDRGSEFQNKRVADEIEEIGLVCHKLPTAGGAFADPNDNAYFAQVEGFYKRMPKSNHEDAIKAIISACYKPTTENIRNYWKKCLYTTATASVADVARLISSHWIYDKKRHDLYESYRQEYRHFRHGDRLLSPDVRRLELPLSVGGDSLDGSHWAVYE
jgi:hypothetical protein